MVSIARKKQIDPKFDMTPYFSKMEKPSSYCEYVEGLPADNLHRVYHDTQYGFPIDSDDELFGRLILEINQAGLSWTTILKKQHHFRLAFYNFDIQKIASFGEKDIEELLDNPGIIRNRLKINAVIYNAQRVREIQREFGSFKAWLEKQKPLELSDWVKLFKKTFKFTGGEITKEFLRSTAHIEGAHIDSCPTAKQIRKLTKS